MSQMVGAIADLGRQYFERPSAASPVETARRLCSDLLSEHGEASGTALAREVVDLYRAMDEAERIAFLEMLADSFAADPEVLRAAARAYLAAPGEDAYLALARAVESPCQELLRRINMAPGGTATIVLMRELLLAVRTERARLRVLDADLRHLFASWFNPGFLQFERIDWRTPAVILEKLIAYEAVHAIRGWTDLRRRLADDRRCFAFFHPALGDEPLIFVEVALTRGIAERIQTLLDSPPPEAPEAVRPDTAIFYSISNCQAGLAGISFGNFLIKQVVDALSGELPAVRTFATLSPVPGFRAWLENALAGEGPGAALLGEDERALLAKPGWETEEITRQRLKKPLMRLCATYLVRGGDGGRPVDPVARFHLGNGASIERINWAGDLSEKGLRQSAGLMVNYRYDPDQIVANHEAYVGQGKVAVSSAVRSLLAGRR